MGRINELPFSRTLDVAVSAAKTEISGIIDISMTRSRRKREIRKVLASCLFIGPILGSSTTLGGAFDSL